MPDSARHGRTGKRALAAVVASAALFSLPAAAYASGSAPSRSGSVSNSTNLAGVTAVATAGAYAYAPSSGDGDLAAVNLSNPASPLVAGTSATASSLMNSTNIAISGGDAYVVSKNRNASMTSNDDGSGNSLTILDVHTNPAVPAIVGTLHDPTDLFGAYGIALSGSDAFVAAQGCLSGQPCPNATVGNSFAVVDVANPANPTLVTALHNSSLPSPWAGSNALDHATSVAISGSYAYVTAFYSDRLTVINISNPAAPTIVASLHDATNLQFPADVAVQGSYAYIADQGSGPEFTVVDISNPSNPTVVGTITNSALDGAYRTKVSGSYAFVSGSSAGAISVIDISQPTKPVIVWSDTDQAHFWRTTGLSFDPTNDYLVASSPALQTDSSSLYPPFPTTTGTISVITLEPAPISVTISPLSEPLLVTSSTVASFQFATNNQLETVACSLDGQAFGPCSSNTSQPYTGLPAGTHTFTVEGIDPAGNTTTASYSWTVQGPGSTGTGTTAGAGASTTAAPVNTAPPSIAGASAALQTLTASTGTWTGTPTPTFTYQWERCNAEGVNCSPIAGATGRTFALSADDVGLTIEVAVVATSSAGAASATSAHTATVRPGPRKRAVKILGLAVAKAHGRYAVHVKLNGSGTLTLTLRRTAPRPASVVERISRGLPAGSSSITLRFHARPGASYTVLASTNGGAKRMSFTVRK